MASREQNQAAVQERAKRGRSRRPAGDGTRALDPEENLRVQEARDHVAASADPEEVVLFHPLLPHLRFGPGSRQTPGVDDDAIMFGPEPHVLKIRVDHPLLFDLLRRHPAIEVVQDMSGAVEPQKQLVEVDRFIDPFTGKEFGSAEALASHFREEYGMEPPKRRRAAEPAG